MVTSSKSKLKTCNFFIWLFFHTLKATERLSVLCLKCLESLALARILRYKISHHYYSYLTFVFTRWVCIMLICALSSSGNNALLKWLLSRVIYTYLFTFQVNLAERLKTMFHFRHNVPCDLSYTRCQNYYWKRTVKCHDLYAIKKSF